MFQTQGIDQYRWDHIHILLKANKALEFDREKALGFHLNISSGTSIRFEPGESKHVEVVEFGGNGIIFGFSGLVSGDLESKREDAKKNIHEKGFKNVLENIENESSSLEIPRNRYVELFGPTTGDRVRLADTDLVMEIEKESHKIWRRASIRRRKKCKRWTWTSNWRLT